MILNLMHNWIIEKKRKENRRNAELTHFFSPTAAAVVA